MDVLKVCLGVWSFLWISTRATGDVEVFCVFMESCILPCSSPGGNDSAIHLTKGNASVHSYFHNKDQLAHQNQHFINRTSLLKNQSSSKNVLFELARVQIQDKGKYTCIIKDISDSSLKSFIHLNVDTPVRKVDIQQVGNRIICSSEGIYPKPELTWSTSPPSNVTLNYTTTVQKTEQQLYNINSSLILSDSVTDLVYSCNISNRRATLFKTTSINASATETTIPCTSSNTPLTGLIWRFNHSQIILNKTGTNVPFTVSEEWRQQVKNVSESGSLTLQDLSSNQEGIYTCEVSNEEETNITNTFLRIEKSQGDSTNVGVIIGGVVVAILVVVVAGLVFYCKMKRDQRGNTPNGETHEKIELGNEGTNGATPRDNYDPANNPLLQGNEDSNAQEVEIEEETSL